MKRILILLILLPTLLYGQKTLRDSVVVKTPIFQLAYSEKLESPLWVKYNVQCPTGTASRSGMNFYTCDSIKTSDDSDYLNNVYDKGHMAPAADFSCTKDMLHQTFTYLNCALQDQYLNRGVWRMLELQEREWAKNETVSVEIVVVFDKSSKKLATGATVPSGFYKTITLTKSKKTYIYYFPNIKPTKSNFSDYLLQNQN